MNFTLLAMIIGVIGILGILCLCVGILLRDIERGIYSFWVILAVGMSALLVIAFFGFLVYVSVSVIGLLVEIL